MEAPAPLQDDNNCNSNSTSTHATASLLAELNAVKSALATEQTRAAALLAEKESLAAEVEDLTKVLFEEANGMVASEARARWLVEQAQQQLQEELERIKELLKLESEQSQFLRQILSQQQDQKHHPDLASIYDTASLPTTPPTAEPISTVPSQIASPQPNVLDADWFASRLTGSYYDDFLPEQAFHSRNRTAACWEHLTAAVDPPAFRVFSAFLDAATVAVAKNQHRRAKKSSSTTAATASATNNTISATCTTPEPTASLALDDDTIIAILEHPFMRGIIHADIEPCLASILPPKRKTSTATGEMRALLRRLLPAMLRNLCVVETLTAANIHSTNCSPTALESCRASPLSLHSVLSVRSSANASPVKTLTVDASERSMPTAMPVPRPPHTHTQAHQRTGSVGSFAHQLIFGTSPTETSSIDLCETSSLQDALPGCGLCRDASEERGLSHRFKLLNPIQTHSSTIGSTSSMLASLFLSSSPNAASVSGPTSSSFTGSFLPDNVWIPICRRCRQRLVAVATLFTLLRHILQGVHARRPKLDIFCELQHARRFMWLAASPLPMEFWAVGDFEAFVRKVTRHQ